MKTEKSTHQPYRTELFVPIMKDENGEYIAVLSDNSTDRDEESISKPCIEKLGKDGGYLVALCNHYNDVFMQVAEWTNKGCREVDGYTALVAEPKFYLSNPNARIIKGMLDEGAKIGVSIGAIVKEYEEIDGKRVYTELELVEASFVAVPSNRHGRAMAVAKSFNKSKEDVKVEKEFTKEDVDSAVEKKAGELQADFKKQLAEKDTEISKLTADLKKAEEDKEKAEGEAEEAKKEGEEKESSFKAELDKVKKEALEKQKHANQGGDPKQNISDEDAEKAFKEGKVPIMNIQ